ARCCRRWRRTWTARCPASPASPASSRDGCGPRAERSRAPRGAARVHAPPGDGAGEGRAAEMAWRRHDLGLRANQIAFDTLHTVSLIAPALREGLTGSGAQRVVRQLRSLLGVAAVALVVDESIVSVDGGPHRHPVAADDQVAEV